MTAHRHTRSALLAGAALALAGACAGDIDGMADTPGAEGPGGTGGDGTSPPGGPSVAPVRCNSLDVGVTPLRRLTRSEYNHTIQDLLGDTSRPADGFAPDETLLGFAAGLSVSPLLVDQYREAAERLAARAVQRLPALLGCDPAATGEDECARRFIDRFGRRAYRRPLDDEQRAGLTGLYRASKTAYGFGKAIELVVQAILQSPEFLYRIERGTPTTTRGIARLDGYELAARLGYLFWGTTPDDALLDAAAGGKLDRPEGLAAEARRLLAHARARRTVAAFHEQWLELEELEGVAKDAKIYPGFTHELREAMRAETLRFAEHVVFEADARLETLLTAPFSFVNRRLAPLYGASGPTGTELVRTDLDREQRSGLLTHASLLSLHAKENQTSPVLRGKFVRERLLCQQLPPPPPDLVVEPPDLDPNLTTRQRFAEHARNPSCSGCHHLIDPVGFGFEHYDGLGRYRRTDGRHPVDASGELVGTRDIDGRFTGAIELGRKLAGSADVQECVAGQWFVYAFGRSVTNEHDRCSREVLFRSFADGRHNLRDLLLALVATDAFRHRRLSPEGGN